jgi:hypothetical protein
MMQLNTFGGSGPNIGSPLVDDNEASWARIDLTHGAGRNQPLHSTGSLGGGAGSPTPSGAQSMSVKNQTEHLKVAAKYERIDRIAMWLFPIIFFLFNVCYWSYFLLLADALSDLW